MKLNSKIIFLLLLFVVLMGCSTKETNLYNLIGLQITSQPIQNYLNKIDTEPHISKWDDAYYYIFKSKGIDFLFSNSDTLVTIFLFSESVNDHRQFQSEIPYGITFNDTRKVVEEKLGPPDKNGGGGVINFFSKWYKKGILIKYKTIDQEDMMNKISCVLLTKMKD